MIQTSRFKIWFQTTVLLVSLLFIFGCSTTSGSVQSYENEVTKVTNAEWYVTKVLLYGGYVHLVVYSPDIRQTIRFPIACSDLYSDPNSDKIISELLSLPEWQKIRIAKNLNASASDKYHEWFTPKISEAFNMAMYDKFQKTPPLEKTAK